MFKNPDLLGASVPANKSTLGYSNTATGLNISNGFQSATKHYQ